MAEALYRLGDALAWAPATAPRGQLVLLQDAVEASGAFLVHHFSALFLKAGHRVCLVANASSPEHYAAVGRKLGVNFAASRAKNQLEVLDVFQSETEMDLATLFATLQTFCSQEQVTGSSGASIVVDDLSAFKWRFGADAVLNFVRCCKTLTHTANGAASVVVLSHSDTELAASRPLNPALADMATVVLTVTPLATGFSKDIHGTLSVHRQSLGLTETSFDDEPVEIPYKILESTVKCFHSGGAALQSN